MRSDLRNFFFVDWKFELKCLTFFAGIFLSAVLLGQRTLAETNEQKVIPTITTPVNNAELKTKTPTFQGAASPNATVEFFVDGVPQGRVQADATGNWRYEIKEATAELENGTHKVRIVVRGPGGEFKSTSEAITIKVSAE